MGDGLSKDTISTGLTTRLLGRNVELHEELDSTNRRAVELARGGAPDGTLVLADAQTAGRGRLGRTWHATPGTSLLLSLILRPPLRPEQAQRVTMVVSLAAVEAIETVTRLRSAIKWPNDILVHGKKAGGVLTELGLDRGSLAFCVVGLGLNVNLDIDDLPEVMTPATSLRREAGREVSRLSLLLSLMERAEAGYERLRRGESPREAWRRRLATLGAQVTASTGADAVQGIAEDVDSDGALLIRDAHGALHCVLAGDVTLRVE